jgi:hypothetical protein
VSNSSTSAVASQTGESITAPPTPSASQGAGGNETSSVPSTLSTVTTPSGNASATVAFLAPRATCGNAGDHGAFRLNVRDPLSVPAARLCTC